MKYNTALKRISHCEKLYNTKGASAVYDYANEIGLEYGACIECDEQTPAIKFDNIVHVCAICGQTIDKVTIS